MYAYIKHSGRQYKVEENAEIIVDTLSEEVGQEIKIEDLIMTVGDDNKLTVNPTGSVTAEIIEHGRQPKILVVKFRKKKNYRRKKGHKQGYTKLLIKSINTQ